MNILILFRQDIRRTPVQCYAHSYVNEFKALGHKITVIGKNHELEHIYQYDPVLLNTTDFILEIENGRDEDGKLPFQMDNFETSPSIPKAVLLIDSHGHPDLHQLISKKYDHVFFAVWARRDLFKDHKSAHWCPNATDLKWFGYENFKHIQKKNDIVFIGSKKGLIRANSLQEICNKNGWLADIREVVKPRRHRWPVTGEAMAAARIGYNRGQKHDGPNQRVLETMAGKLPLLNDLDATDGMSKLFINGKHYIGYDKNNASDLEEKLFYLLDNPAKAEEIAIAGYEETKNFHLIKNRVKLISEICNLGV